MLTPQTLEHFDEISEHEQTALHGTATPIWRIIITLLCGVVGLLLCAGCICLYQGLTPTLYNMLSASDKAAPFAVSAINALQAAHFIVAMAIYYRTWHRSVMLARLQLGLAVATHGSLLLVLFLLPFLGWSQDWASPFAVVVWGAWELAALLALKRIYQYRLQRERRHYKLSWVSFVAFCFGAVAYIVPKVTVFCVVRRTNTKKVLRLVLVAPLMLLCAEGLMGLAVLAYMVLLLIHTKRVYFTMHVEAGVSLHRLVTDKGTKRGDNDK